MRQFTPPRAYKRLSGLGVKPTIPDPPGLSRFDPGYKATDILVNEWAYNVDDKIWFCRGSDGIKEYFDSSFKKGMEVYERFLPTKPYGIGAEVRYKSTTPAFQAEKIYKAILTISPGQSPETHPSRWTMVGIFDASVRKANILEFKDGIAIIWSDVGSKPTWLDHATLGAFEGGHSHPEATTGAKGMMSASDKTKLNGIATNANNYVHPATHPPSIITQDINNRFVTDTEKGIWNGMLPATEVTTSPTASKVLRLNSTSMFPVAVIRGASQSLSIAPGGTGTVLANRGKVTVTNSSIGPDYSTSYFYVNLPAPVFLGQEIEFEVNFTSNTYGASVVVFRYNSADLYEFNVSGGGAPGTLTVLFQVYDGMLWRLRSDVNNLITTSGRTFLTTTEKGRIPTATEKTNNANAVLFAIPGAWKTVGAGGTFENGAAVPGFASGVTGPLYMRLVNNNTRMEIQGRVVFTSSSTERTLTASLATSIRPNARYSSYAPVHCYAAVAAGYRLYVYNDLLVLYGIPNSGSQTYYINGYYDIT